ncbi:hypothetical protein F5879DRAFT_996188 [Lentinula edodes]|nr:hypothetical protein F5879DRAFT_996188 [Lentinula edodes]
MAQLYYRSQILVPSESHPSSSLAADRIDFTLAASPSYSSSVSMRRSLEELQRRYEMRETRGISNADGQGYLYAYVDNDRWKVGMTNEFVCRQEEWDKDCPYPWRVWLPPIQVANRRRAEALAHILLEMECLHRPRIYCQRCQRVHIEKFVFSGTWHVVWSTIVYPILLRAAIS